MRRKSREILAFLLAVIICTSSWGGVFVLAADGTVTNADGTKTTQATTTSTTTDSGTGNVTNVETVTKDTSGTVYDATFAKNVTLQKKEIIKTTILKDANQNILKKTVYESESGSGKYTATQNAASAPAVSVTLTPGSTKSATATVTGSTTMTGDQPANASDKTYDYRKVTVGNGTRTVSGTMSTVTFGSKVNNGTTFTRPHYSKLTLDTGGGGVVYEVDAPESDVRSAFIYKDRGAASNISKYYPLIHTRTAEEYAKLPSDMKSYYTWVEWADLGKNTNVQAEELTRIRNYYETRKAQTGEAIPDGLYTIPYAKRKSLSWIRSVEDNTMWEWLMVARPHKLSSANKMIFTNATNSEPKEITYLNMKLLYDRFGNETMAYCVDRAVIATPLTFYTQENLSEATYFKGTAAQVEDAKARIRAAAIYGYWARANGNYGSRSELIANLKAAINDSSSGLTSLKYSTNTSRTASKVYSKDQLLSYANGIDNAEALLATQAAIWRYGRSGQEFIGFQGKDVASQVTMELIYAWLTSDYLKNKVNKPTILIDDDSFFDPASVKVTVKGKVSGDSGNTDSNANNDVYNVDLSFTMYHNVTANDNLSVYLYDTNGSKLKEAKLGTVSTSAIKRNGNTYTLEGLKMAENSEVTYKLVIKGTQTIATQEAFIFRATGGYEDAQTLIGVGTGVNTVDTSGSFKWKIDVTEPAQSVTGEHLWAWERTTTNEYAVISGTKTWNDANNQDGVRPSSIMINLLADGVKVSSKTVTAADGWKWTFGNLDKTKDGRDIVYTITEDKVTGYTTAVNGYNVTNTHVPEKVTISGTKTWDDNNNQDGNRPDSITVNLLANGEEVAEKTVTAADGWKWTFANVAKYKNGKQIVYTVTEDQVTGYAGTVNGYDITNKYTQVKTTVSGSKTWKDAEDQDGIRPDSITIRLFADGAEFADQTVTATDDWSWEFTELPKYKDGAEIVYTIQEDAVPGYESTVDGYDVTNEHVPVKTSVSGSKTWMDNNDAHSNRPESITIRLLADGVEVAEKTVTAADDWKWNFADLAKYKNGGTEIVYTITEDAVPFYTGEVNGYDVTNTYVPEVMNISGTKTWNDSNNQDGKRPASITINLLADGEEVAEKTVTVADGWSWEFTGLTKYQNRKEVSYTITEDTVPDYNSEVSGYNVTNTHVPETVVISGTKTWNDSNNQDGKRPASITINLLADGVEVAEKTVTAADGWSWEFTGYARYDAGREIVYSIAEAEVAGYTSTISGYDVTNSYQPETIEISGSKNWVDNDNADGNRPASIVINLLADGVEVAEKTVTAADDWKWNFKGLDRYKNGGAEIEYTVTEDAVPYYRSEVNGHDVTNTYVPEMVTVSGIKTWDDGDNQDGKRPASIIINLLADGEQVAQKEVTAADNWSWTFTDLKKYQNGHVVAYTITEDEVAGYTSAISGYDVTNSYQPETIEISGSKNWVDNNNADGNRPTSIVINLLADGVEVAEKTVTAADDWKWNFTGLDRYKNGGTEIVYSVTEDSVNGYLVSYNGYNVTNTQETTHVSGSKSWNDANDQDGKRPDSITIRLMAGDSEVASETVTAADGWNWSFENLPKYRNGQEVVYTISEDAVAEYSSEVNGYNVTNSYTPKLVNISGSKSWNDANDQDGKRPESIVINLLANGEEIAEKTVTAADGWSWEFNGYAKYNAGQEIVYTITEDEVAEYTTEINGYDVTNSHLPETINVNGTKTWADNDNTAGNRPESITIRLLADGVEVAEKTVTASDGWSWSFAGLARYSAGREIVYTITEDAVVGYKASYDGYNVTNKTEEISVSGGKTWDDCSDRDGKRPESIIINLLADGVEVAEQTVTAADNWSWSFTGLSKYRNGQEVTYTITEDEVSEYTCQINGYDVTNSYTPETIDIIGSKTWADAENLYGNRPDGITINLLADGVEVAEQTVTEADSWSWSFAGMDRYKNGGTEIVYSVTEDSVNGYEASYEGYNVTNTPETITVSGSKIWNDCGDQDGKRPDSITIRLLMGGSEVASKTVTAADGWSWSFENLPKYHNGQEAVYTVSEDAVAEYTSEVNGYNVTNSYTPELISISGSKIWMDNDDADGKRPASIAISLLADGSVMASKTVSEADGWSWSFDNLPKYRSGQEITYVIKEDAVPNYSGSVSGGDIVNTYNPELITISGYKNWVDGNDQDGIRPDTITINLFADGTMIDSKAVSAADGWSWSFENLPKLSEGREIVYSISEDTVEGYTSEVSGYNVTNTHTPETISVSGSKTWNDFENQDGKRPDSITIYLLAENQLIGTKVVTAADNWSWNFEEVAKYKNGIEIEYTIAEAAVEGYTSEVNGYNVINSYTPETTTVSGSKMWEDNRDQDGIRPASIKVYLLENGREVDSRTVTGGDNWSWTFTGLPKYNAGQEIVYTITEEAVEGYTCIINGYNLTNCHTPETITVSGSKIWEDNNDQAGKRPASIVINLLANGEVKQSKTVTAGESWSWTFSDLPRFKAGQEIEYTITENAVENYLSTVDGYNVTNKYIAANAGGTNVSPSVPNQPEPTPPAQTPSDGEDSFDSDDSGYVEIPEENPPLAGLPADGLILVDLFDEAVPLAAVPRTGDNIATWFLMTLFASSALIGLKLCGKKKNNS